MNVIRFETGGAEKDPTQRGELARVPAASPGVRARKLLAQAREASAEQLHALIQSIEKVRALSDEVAAGGDLYGFGIQDFARRMSEDLHWRSKTLEVLAARQDGRAGQNVRG
jgi:hypothetical protein